MDNLEKIFNYGKAKVRTLIKNSGIWFVAKDVCHVLEIKDTRQAVGRLDGDERCLITVTDSLGRKQETFVVNEFGLYNLILGSRKKEAKDFKRWVTHEVFPSIRVSGGYGEPVDEPFDPEWRGYAMRQLTMENDLLRGELDRYDDLFDNTKKLAESVLHKAVVKAEGVKKSSVVRGVRIDSRGTKEIIRERSE